MNSDSTGYSSAEEEESMPLGGQVIMRMNRGNREDQNHVDE